MKKHFSYSSPRQIWRILISDSEKIIVETRDQSTKEVFFTCVDLNNATTFFDNLQLEEKFWLGIEEIHNDVIFFHKYPKPDLPAHREIIAFDINKRAPKWINSDYSFLFIHSDKIYAFRQGFEERHFVTLDIETGAVTEEIGPAYALINSLKAESESRKDFSNYLFPKRLSEEPAETLVKKNIDFHSAKLEITGDVEYNVYKNILLFSFHSKVFLDSMVNKFLAIDLKSGTVLLNEILNERISALLTDSFFVYRDFLFLLREKNGIEIYKMD